MDGRTHTHINMTTRVVSPRMRILTLFWEYSKRHCRRPQPESQRLLRMSPHLLQSITETLVSTGGHRTFYRLLPLTTLTHSPHSHTEGFSGQAQSICNSTPSTPHFTSPLNLKYFMFYYYANPTNIMPTTQFMFQAEKSISQSMHFWAANSGDITCRLPQRLKPSSTSSDTSVWVRTRALV